METTESKVYKREKRKKSNNLLVIICVLLIIGSSIGIWFDKDNLVATIVSTATTIIGAVAIWIQFAKNRELIQLILFLI